MKPLSKYVLLSLGLAAGLVSSARADSVTKLNGETVKGEITRDTSQEVVIVVQGRAQRIPRRELAADGVQYEGEPRELREAEEALAQRNFDGAHRGFRAVIEAIDQPAAPAADAKANGGKAKKAAAKKPALAGASIRPIFLQRALYGEVRTFAAEGKSAKAIEAVDELLAKVKDTAFLADALRLKVKQVISGGKADEVAGAVADAKKRAADSGALDAGEGIDLDYAEFLGKSGKSAEAQKILKDVERSSTPRIAEAAKLGLAQLQLAANDTVGAKITFLSLLRESKDQVVKCGAARGLGDCQMQDLQKTQQKSADGLGEALESYLRAEVLYFPGENDRTDEHRLALLRAVECAVELVNVTKKEPRAAQGYRKVAQEISQELQTLYRGTAEARKADEAVRRLGAGAP